MIYLILSILTLRSSEGRMGVGVGVRVGGRVRGLFLGRNKMGRHEQKILTNPIYLP